MPLKLGVLRLGARLGSTLENPERLLTGCESLDAILGGGIVRGEVTEVFGPPTSGRTNLALSVAARVLLRGLSVLYVDADGGVVPSRVRELVVAAASRVADSDRVEPVNATRIKAATERFLCSRVCSWEELAGGIANTVSEVVSARGDVALLVVDSVALPYRWCRQDNAPKRLEAFAAQMARVAVRQHVAVLLVNNARGTDVLSTSQFAADSCAYPRAVAREVGYSAMGDAWSHVCPTRVGLGWSFDHHRVAHVVKSSRVPPARTIFHITRDGIEEDDWD